jgi:uncharacterized protein YaiI (UPF0178 family)
LIVKIWVDADACPAVIRDILFKAADRTGTRLTLVANRSLRLPPSPNIRALQVAPGFDVADNEIVRLCASGDLVITSDIPLASDVIDKGAYALNPRGELYSADTIRAKLNMRDFMETLRASGVQTGGKPALSQTERREFSNHLDRLLARRRAD